MQTSAMLRTFQQPAHAFVPCSRAPRLRSHVTLVQQPLLSRSSIFGSQKSSCTENVTCRAILPADALASSIIFADVDAQTAGTLAFVLRPLFTLTTILFIVRIVLTWFPEQDGKQFPWSLSYGPTEPLLAATRKVVPPLAGVDVSPIVWVAIISFLNEILLGPQGILNLIQRQAQL